MVAENFWVSCSRKKGKNYTMGDNSNNTIGWYQGDEIDASDLYLDIAFVYIDEYIYVYYRVVY